MRKKQLFLVFLLVISGLAGRWWYSQKSERPVTYITTVVGRGPITRLVVATGTVNPVTTVQVGTYVSGPIKALFADFNSAVKKGQRVAQIDPRPFLVKVKQAEANLTTARAQVEKDKADLTFKQRAVKRTRELFERNLIAKQEVEAAERDVEQAQAQYHLDQARVDQNAAALEEAQVNLGYTDIVSPVDGVVVSRSVNVGQTVAASFQTPGLFQVAQDLTKMQVNTNVSESDIGLVAEGQRTFFAVDAYPERKFWGTITQVRNAPQIVQNVVTYDVVVDVDNADLALKPGMTASLSVVTAHREDVVKIPQAALRFRLPVSRKDGEYTQDGANGERPEVPMKRERMSKDSSQVWLQEAEQKLTAVSVQTGISDETFVELVTGNLKEGDVIVTGVRTAREDTPQTTLPGFGMRWRR